MPTSSCPAGRLDPPRSTMGQGKEMRRVPCTPRDSNSMSHTALRCRCRPSGPGGTCWVQAGSGCLAARVTRSRGGRCGPRPTRRGTAGAPPPRAPYAPWRCWPRCLPNVESAATPHCAHCRPRLVPVHRRCLRAGRHRGLGRARRAPQAIGAGACTGAWCGAEYPATKR